MVTRKLYTPARMAPQNSYPHWHKICETLTLLVQNFGPNPYPYWHKSTKKGTLCGTTIVEKWLIGTNFDILHSPLHNHWKKPYPFWHTFGVQNPTLSGTLLENPTLCGTEIGQNGVLAYAHCRQWECPPGLARLVFHLIFSTSWQQEMSMFKLILTFY